MLPHLKSSGNYLRELFFCLLYFFFNGVFLPEGLYYTTLLSPLFLAYLLKKGYTKPLLYFIIPSLVLFYIHYQHGIHLRYYMISSLLLLSCYIFILTAYDFVKHTRHLEKIFSRIIYLNIILMCLAGIAFFIPAWFSSFWYVNDFTSGVSTFARLKMFTNEASHYAIIFAPVSLYYILKAFKPGTKHVAFILIASLLPLVLSFSFGVIAAMLLALFLMVFIDSHKLPAHTHKFKGIFILASVALVVGVLIVMYVPDNPVLIRLKNIFNNNDTSFKGRTTDSFVLAYEMAKLKSLLFGMGPGQVKVYGPDLYDHFYKLTTDATRVIRIPNAIGETLAIYGIVGLLLRFGILFYCYFKTQVYNNYYRQALFIFMFIYQFTGSNIVSINEYAIWILAFSVTQFHEFDKRMLPPIEPGRS